MPKFSANLGFLWSDRPLPDRITAAAAAGFEAVECHFPYDVAAAEVRDALLAANVSMISLNTGLGSNGQVDFGVAARPGRETEARELIDQAIEYAAVIGCHHVNVVPGATGRAAGCEDVFRHNLAYAAERAAADGIGILIEPLSAATVPNAHVALLEHGVETVNAVGADNVRLMFDCFHIQLMGGDVTRRFLDHRSLVGHIQIAAVPDRAEPDHGELSYPWMFDVFDTADYDGWVGAEYHPVGAVEDGLGWFRSATAATAANGKGSP